MAKLGDRRMIRILGLSVHLATLFPGSGLVGGVPLLSSASMFMLFYAHATDNFGLHHDPSISRIQARLFGHPGSFVAEFFY
jgi:hypothetical protein